MFDQSYVREILGDRFTDDATFSHAPNGKYYTDPAVHEMELDRVFGHEWNYVCHRTQVPEKGDYLVTEIAGESIYVQRGRDDVIRAFYNVCQHRGHELLTGTGNPPSVVKCPYHAWCYDHDGNLKGAPKMREVKGFDRGDVKLSGIRCELAGGFVFINFDEDAAPFHEMAPEFEPIITAMVGEVERLQFVKKNDYDINANWKIVTENFLEAYHVEFSGEAHLALGDIIDTDTYDFSIDGRTIEYTAGGGAPEVMPYDMSARDDFTNAKDKPFHQVFLFPHMTFSVFPGTNMMFVFNMRPNGVGKTAEEIIYFTLDGTFSEPSETAEAYLSDALNPEDIALVEAVHRGLKSRGYNPGRLMVDTEAKAGWSEHFVHHFNMLNLQALEQN